MSTKADIVERLGRSLKPFWHHTQHDVIGDAMAEITNLRSRCGLMEAARDAATRELSLVSTRAHNAEHEAEQLRAERDAAALENARLRAGLGQIVDMRNPATRAQVREACAEILAGGSAILATEGDSQ